MAKMTRRERWEKWCEARWVNGAVEGDHERFAALIPLMEQEENNRTGEQTDSD